MQSGASGYENGQDGDVAGALLAAAQVAGSFVHVGAQAYGNTAFADQSAGQSANGLTEPSEASQSGTTVELLYTETPVAGAYHAFPLVTGPDGEQFYARGGTLARTEGAGRPKILGGEGVFKTIEAKSGRYQPGTVDYTTEPVARQTVLRSGDPGAYGKFTGILRGFANDVNAADIPYRPFTQNSNSFAFTAVGLLPGATIPKPPVYAPGYDTILRTGQ
jgi:hypothetical protein